MLIINQGRIITQGEPAALRRQLQPGEHLYVVISGASRGEALRLLERIPGVEAVSAQDDGYRLRLRPNAEARGEIADRVVKAGFRLLELRPVAMTLEDIFLDIVGKGS